AAARPKRCRSPNRKSLLAIPATPTAIRSHKRKQGQVRTKRAIQTRMPKDRVHQKKKRGRDARPTREHPFAENECSSQTEPADNDRNRCECPSGIAKDNINDSAKQYKEWVSRGLGLMNTRIELLEREGKIDVVDRQIRRHCRDPGQQQQRKYDDP